MADGFKEVPSPNDLRQGDIFLLTVLKGCLSVYVETRGKKEGGGRVGDEGVR